jgi:hypothetical protein
VGVGFFLMHNEGIFLTAWTDWRQWDMKGAVEEEAWGLYQEIKWTASMSYPRYSRDGM